VQALDTADDLVRVKASEDCERAWLTRSSSAEANNGVVNQSVLLQLHDVVQVGVILLRVDCESENSVDVIKAVSLVESEEVERRACSVVLVETGRIRNHLTSQLSRAVVEVLRLPKHLLSGATLCCEGGRFALANIFAGQLVLQSRRVENGHVLLLLTETRVVTQVRRNSEVVRSSVEQNSGWLLFRTQKDLADVAGTIFVFKLDAESSLSEAGLVTHVVVFVVLVFFFLL